MSYASSMAGNPSSEVESDGDVDCFLNVFSSDNAAAELS